MSIQIMGRLLLLAITLCTLGPICVNCYWTSVVETITTLPGELTQDQQVAVASLRSGNVEAKCAQARADAQAAGVVLGPAVQPNVLPRMGKYGLPGPVFTGVMGFLVHDNPPVVLTNTLQVYAQRNEEPPASSCVKAEPGTS